MYAIKRTSSSRGSVCLIVVIGLLAVDQRFQERVSTRERTKKQRNRQRPITLSLLIFESLARDYRMRENHGEWWLVFLIRTEGSRSLLFRETIAETANNHYLVTNSTRIPAIIIRAFLFEPSSYVNQ